MGDRSRGLSFRACEGKSGRLFVTKTLSLQAFVGQHSSYWPASSTYLAWTDTLIDVFMHHKRSRCLVLLEPPQLHFQGLLSRVEVVAGRLRRLLSLKSKEVPASWSFDTSKDFLVTSWHHVLS